MTFFRYRARNRDGAMVEGRLEAAGEKLAVDMLSEKGFEIVFIEEVKKKWVIPLRLPQFISVRLRDVVIFTRQLSVLLSANITIVASLRTVARQTVNATLQRIIVEIADEVEAGGRLSQAFSKYPSVFDDFFVNMVRSGEMVGRLDEILERLADQKEKDYDLMSRIHGAMIYPAFIITGLVIVSIVLMVFVIPQLTGVLKESGAPLPLSTRLLIGTSGFLQKYWLLLFLAVILGASSFRLGLKRSPSLRYLWDRFKLRLPILGNLYQKIYLTRFAQGLLTLTVGGVDIVTSLRIVADIVGNTVYKDLIIRTIREVEDGNSITSVFSKSPYVPGMVNQMLGVGEETGKINIILEKLAAFYTREINNLVGNLVSIIEPFVIVIMGIAVGVIVSSIILPMYRLSAQF